MSQFVFKLARAEAAGELFHQVCLEMAWESTGFTLLLAWLFGHAENRIVDGRIDVDVYNTNLHRIPAIHLLTHSERHHYPMDSSVVTRHGFVIHLLAHLFSFTGSLDGKEGRGI